MGKDEDFLLESMLPTCVYSVVGLEVGQFVVGLLTVGEVAAERLLAGLEAGGGLKDSWSRGHLWQNHRSLQGCSVQVERTLW